MHLVLLLLHAVQERLRLSCGLRHASSELLLLLDSSLLAATYLLLQLCQGHALALGCLVLAHILLLEGAARTSEGLRLVMMVSLLSKWSGVLVLMRVERRRHRCRLLPITLVVALLSHRVARHLVLELRRRGRLAVLERRLEVRGHGRRGLLLQAKRHRLHRLHLQHRLEVVLPWVLLLIRLLRLVAHRLLLAHFHEAGAALLIRLSALYLHEGTRGPPLQLLNLAPLLAGAVLLLAFVQHVLAHLLLLDLAHRGLLLLLLVVRLLLLQVQGGLLLVIRLLRVLLAITFTRKLSDSQHLAILCDDLLLLEVLLLLVHHCRSFLSILLLIVVPCAHIGLVLRCSGGCCTRHGLLIVILQLLLYVMVLHRASWHLHHLLSVLANSILQSAGASIVLSSLAHRCHHLLLLLLLLLN